MHHRLVTVGMAVVRTLIREAGEVKMCSKQVNLGSEVKRVLWAGHLDHTLVRSYNSHL